MKRHKKILVGVLLFAFLFGVFGVNNAFAAWMGNATILWIKVTDDGNYAIRAQSGAWVKTFTVDTTLANAKAILAVALTATSMTETVSIEFDGSIITNIYLTTE